MYEKPFIDALARSIGDRYAVSSPMIVAIGGRACSGKSTLAGQLVTAIGSSALYLAFDDFFMPFAEHRHDRTGAERYFRFDEFRAVINDLSQARPAEYRRYNWHGGDYQPTMQINASLVFVDGLYVLDASLLSSYTYTIWVEGCTTTRMDRVIKRDGDALLDRWINEWIPDEECYVNKHQPWKLAEFVVAGAGMELSRLNNQLGN